MAALAALGVITPHWSSLPGASEDQGVTADSISRTILSWNPCSLSACRKRSLSSRGGWRTINLKSTRKALLQKQGTTTQCSYATGIEPIDVVAEVRNEKILVLGGNGFVGSAVCKRAVAQGIDVVSLNRSGPPTYTDPWVDDVNWVRGDVFTADWPSLLAGVSTVISCIGGFGSNEAMETINGDATIAAVNGAEASGVTHFVFVSVHDYNLPSFALENGYFNGKRRAEAQVLAKFPTSGVVLRPGFIYGKRRVNTVDIPLDLVGRPLEAALKAAERFTEPLASLPASDLLLAPPVDVDDVAAAAVAAVVDRSISGVLTIQQIKETAARAGA